MFDLSWAHILILLIVALVVVGPKDLPRLMHMIGRWIGKARAMANEFRRSFDEMARQTELDELRKEIAALRAERPLANVERDMQRHIEHGILPADEKPGPDRATMPQTAEPAPPAPAEADRT
ncbi:MAG TPA: Sec-independent protein translocase protein TatB [Rhizomicrobium sp.]|nr:Sec-independent protein translocase protein TatB [Rhizomicrobium sp.]